MSVDTLEFEENAIQKIFLEGAESLLFLVKQVFKNVDGSSGLQYLVTSDTTLTYDEIRSL